MQRSRPTQESLGKPLFEYSLNRNHPQVVRVRVDGVSHKIDLTQHHAAVELEPLAFVFRGDIRWIGPGRSTLSLSRSKLSILVHEPQSLPSSRIAYPPLAALIPTLGRHNRHQKQGLLPGIK